ncbi:hypothetical protein ABIE45_006269 [Methylobacterium sp. OAE515]
MHGSLVVTTGLPTVLLRGTPRDRLVSLELNGSAIAMHAVPFWHFDELLELADVLAQGVYCLVGVDNDSAGKAPALIREGEMKRERLASHASDPRLDWVYELICWPCPRVMSDTVRLCLQRRLADELLSAERIGRLVGDDPERATASIYDSVAADGILEDMRMLAGLATPGIMDNVISVRAPIATRSSILPRWVDPQRMTCSTREMAYAGARATANMLARETMLLSPAPRSSSNQAAFPTPSVPAEPFNQPALKSGGQVSSARARHESRRHRATFARLRRLRQGAGHPHSQQHSGHARRVVRRSLGRNRDLPQPVRQRKARPRDRQAASAQSPFPLGHGPLACSPGCSGLSRLQPRRMRSSIPLVDRRRDRAA